MFFWVLACSGGQKIEGDTSSHVDSSISGGIDRSVDRDLQLITCIQFERTHWEELDMCKIHLQFYVPEPYEHIETEPAAQGEVCVLEQGSLEPPLFTPMGIDAGERITLRNEHQEIVMFRSTSEADGVSYFMNDCNEETFPFGASFDLHVSGSSLPEGVPPFGLEEAIHFGSDMVWETENIEQSFLDALDVSLDWTYTHAISEAVQRKHQILVERDAERLRCEPQEQSIMIPSSDIQMLQQPSQSALLIYDAMYFGPVRRLPWDMEYQSVMVYRSRGDLSWE